MPSVTPHAALRNILLALLVLCASGFASAQPYGLTQRSNIGAYLNGLFPATDPGAGPNSNDLLPQTITATGVFSNIATLAPNAGLVPYTLIQPLWSDGAVKSRWIALPYTQGAPSNPAVSFSPSGDWVYPDGTVFVKHFEMVINEQTGERRRLETRILVRDSSGWIYGRTYVWNPEQTEATITLDGGDIPLVITNPDGVTTRNQTYTFPSALDCQTCHNQIGGTLSTHGVLGPKTAQLNGNLTYTAAISANGTGVTDNQLRTWNNLGMFDVTLVEAAIANYDRHAALGDSTATLEKRVRSYLDANCAGCHRPSGFNTAWRAPYTIPILQTDIAGTPNAKLRRFDPNNSQIIVRDSLPSFPPSGPRGMPPLDKNVVHQAWIDHLVTYVNYPFDLAATYAPAGNTKVRAVFNSDLNPASATTLANYAMNNGINVTGAVLEPDKRTVTLTTTAMSPGANYTLTVNNVREAAAPGNGVFPNTNRAFQNVTPSEVLQFSAATYSVIEGAGVATLTVTRTGGAGAVSVNYATQDGSALSGSDYSATTGTLNWANGDTASKTFTVPIVNDARMEAPETFTVFLSAATGGAVVGDRLTATVTILDDDGVDFNADGKADLLVRGTDGRVQIWPMDGVNAVSMTDVLGPNSGFTPMQLADLNGDGKTDIVWQHTDGRVVVWLMNGPAFAGGGTILAANAVWNVHATGDFDGDGKGDILWRNANGSYAIWLMNGASPVGGGTILAAGSGWTATRIADFNGDGKDDILWTHADGRAAIWLMNGGAVIGGGGILGAGTGWAAIQTPDLNGDGMADIVWRHTDGRIAVWIMNGAVVTGGGGIFGGGTAWTVGRVGDFDGDGKVDLLFTHPDGRASVWLMDGGTSTAQLQIIGAGGWVPKRTADLNGDGKADIVWQHTDGRVAVWLMNGTAVIGSGNPLGAGTIFQVSTITQ